MSIVLHADTSSWLHLPGSFPTASGELAREWEDRVVTGMREAWRGTLNAAKESAVRESLRHGLRRALPDDAVTLQYWPTTSVVNAIVHIAAREFAPGEQAHTIPLDEGPYEAEPVTVAFESEFLGTGVEARYLSAVDTQPPLVLGAVNYLFENSFGYIFVAVEPTLPRLLGIMLEPLRDVVRSIRVLDDGGGAWEKCTVDASKLGTRGEAWSLESPEEAVA